MKSPNPLQAWGCTQTPNHSLQPTCYGLRPRTRLSSTLGFCRVSLESFVECADVRLPNRLLCASAGSVCVTWRPPQILSRGRYTHARASDSGSRDASRGFVVMRAAAVSRRRCSLVKVAVC